MDLGIILTLKNILIKNQVYFADPNSFNDPFDCKNDSIYAAINLEKQMKINPSFNTRPSYLGVLSTSLIWNSILMWSHYGNFHKGYNIGFDFKKNERVF